jgi:hypothetical protein
MRTFERMSNMPERERTRRAATGFAFLAVIGFPAMDVEGADLSENLANTTSGTESATVDRWIAAAFTTDASEPYRLASVTLLLARTSPGTAALDLDSDRGLEPGSLVAALTPPSSYAATPTATTFTAPDLSLDAGATYWVVLRAQSGTFEWAWTADNTGGGAGFTPAWDLSEDAGAAWYACDVYPVQLQVTVNATGTTRKPFHRGDPDDSGAIDLSDGITIFNYLFLGNQTSLGCRESADANNDGTIDISDGIVLLNWLFLGGAEPAAPGLPAKPCGLDPDAEGSPLDVGCESYLHCN